VTGESEALPGPDDIEVTNPRLPFARISLGELMLPVVFVACGSVRPQCVTS